MGATNFDEAMAAGVEGCHVEIVKLCKEWGETNFTEGDRIEIKKLCRKWRGFGDIHREVFSIITSANFFRQIHDGVLPIAWHPERFWDWCVDEEKRLLEERLWLSCWNLEFIA